MRHTITHYLPELDERERFVLDGLTSGMSDETLQQFAASYRQVRKDPQTLRILAIIGIIAIPGLHRFYMGQAGIGFLYLLTYGLLLFGTVADIVRYRELAIAHNQQIAKRVANNLTKSGHEPLSPLLHRHTKAV